MPAMPSTSITVRALSSLRAGAVPVGPARWRRTEAVRVHHVTIALRLADDRLSFARWVGAQRAPLAVLAAIWSWSRGWAVRRL